MISVATHGATGDGTTDDRASIISAISALSTTDRHLLFPPGRYKVSKYVPLQNIDGLQIHGEGATILYQSADTGLSTDGVATSNTMVRSGLLFIDCGDLVVRDLQFEGNSVQADITVNIGVGCYVRNCLRARFENLCNWYGGALLSQENQTGDVGLRLVGSYSYGARNPIGVGSDCVVDGCRIEQPTDSGYNRSGDNGSSHGIYLFAGRKNVLIRNCHFKNVRVDAIKGSGSSAALSGLVVQGCSFIDCGGGVLWGADDVQNHDGFIVEGNYFEDCGTNIAGWTTCASIVVLGSSGSIIRDNVLRYTRTCLGTVAAVKGIQIQRYSGSAKECRNVLVAGNLLHAEGLSPSQIVTQALYGYEVDGLTLDGNVVRGVGGVAISVQAACDRAIIRGNLIRDVVTAIGVTTSSGVAALDNVLHRGSYTSTNPIVSVDSTSRPNFIQRDNVEVAADGKSSLLVV